MAKASGPWVKHWVGSRHASDGFFNHSQCNLSHPSKSIAPLRAYDSDAKVEPTTRDIFLEYHMSGLTGLACHWPISLDDARIRQPFWDCALALVAKLASEKETNRRSFRGMDLIWIRTCLCNLASWSNLFASINSATVAVVILAWRKLSRADNRPNPAACWWMRTAHYLSALEGLGVPFLSLNWWDSDVENDRWKWMEYLQCISLG